MSAGQQIFDLQAPLIHFKIIVRIVAYDLCDPKQAHGHRHKVNAGVEVYIAEYELCSTKDQVNSDPRHKQADKRSQKNPLQEISLSCPQ